MLSGFRLLAEVHAGAWHVRSAHGKQQGRLGLDSQAVLAK